MKMYRTVLFVRADQLSMLLSLLEDVDGVQVSSNITDAADITPLPPTPPPPRPSLPTKDVAALKAEIEAPKTAEPPSRYVNGRRNKGVGGAELILETLRGGAATVDELKRTFTHSGFSPTSVSPCLSRLLRDKRVQHAMHGRYMLTSDAGNGSLR
jgi:hypothetical protein